MRCSRKLAIVLVAVVVVALLLATAVMAQRGRGMRGRSSGRMTMSVPGLQQYPLSTDQRNEIARIRTESRQQMQQVRQDPNLSSQEKADRISQIRQQTHDRVMGVLTPQQRQEFMSWWSSRQQGMPARGGAGPGMGMGMGMGPVTGMMPGLTQNPLSAAQRQRIMNIRSSFRQQMMDVRNNRDLSSEQKTDQIAQLMQQQHQQVMDVLTPAQQQEFNNWWSSRQQSMGSMQSNQ